LYQRRPLLVMDEVAAVLDSGRALNLVAMVTEQVAQVFMTTPRRDVPAGLSAFAGQTVAVSEGAARSVAGGTP
jgi:recombinational DNA repair ATPase RecF